MTYILIPLFCVKRKIMLINVWKRIFSVSFFLILYSVLYSTVCVPCVPPIMKKWWWWQMTITMTNIVIDNDWWWWRQRSLKFWWHSNDALAVIVNNTAPWYQHMFRASLQPLTLVTSSHWWSLVAIVCWWLFQSLEWLLQPAYYLKFKPFLLKNTPTYTLFKKNYLGWSKYWLSCCYC